MNCYDESIENVSHRLVWCGEWSAITFSSPVAGVETGTAAVARVDGRRIGRAIYGRHGGSTGLQVVDVTIWCGLFYSKDRSSSENNQSKSFKFKSEFNLSEASLQGTNQITFRQPTCYVHVLPLW